MFRFENPQYLYFLGAILVLAALHYYATYRKKKKLSTYGDPELMKFLMILPELLSLKDIFILTLMNSMKRAMQTA